MSNFWIGSVVEYNKSTIDKINFNEDVKQHSPVYSPDGKEVLVKGAGNMTIEQVKAYQSEKWVAEGGI